MPNVEFKRRARLSRQEVADRLIALGKALGSGSEVELSSGGDTLKLGVAGHVDWELEVEIDGNQTEIEIEIKWTDEPSDDAELDAGQASASEKGAAPRRRRPRKVAEA